jgi:hypothetical protein
LNREQDPSLAGPTCPGGHDHAPPAITRAVEAIKMRSENNSFAGAPRRRNRRMSPKNPLLLEVKIGFRTEILL